MQKILKLKSNNSTNTLNFETNKNDLLISVRDKDGVALNVFKIEGEKFVAEVDELVQEED